MQSNHKIIYLVLIAVAVLKFGTDYHQTVVPNMPPRQDAKTNTTTTESKSTRFTRAAKNMEVNPKTILFATKWWFSQWPFLKEASNRCPQCKFTEEKDRFNTSDAVVFFSRTVNSRPPKGVRPRNQIWVWLQFEAPNNMDNQALFKSTYLNAFNWTMSYRRDSDIYMPYGEIIPTTMLQRPSFNETWAFLPSDVGLPEDKRQQIYKEALLLSPTVGELKGRRMVAMIASSCSSPSSRMAIAKGLQKYIEVDIYGKCGSYSCEFDKSRMSTSANPGIDCRIQIANKYKFYLAFENAVCEDYVTEKYFDTYFTQMVPVVYGGFNYSSLPPNSYIDVRNFKTVKHLAEHLKSLDQNTSAFLKYFEWKREYWVKNNGFIAGWCNLCDKLWAGHAEAQPDGNVQHWWTQKSDFKVSGRNSCLSKEETKTLIENYVV